MLEHWYKERRTLVDFRRGPLGLTSMVCAYLKAKGYAFSSGAHPCANCLFNDFLAEKEWPTAKTPESLIDDFLDDIWRTIKPRACTSARGLRIARL